MVFKWCHKDLSLCTVLDMTWHEILIFVGCSLRVHAPERDCVSSNPALPFTTPLILDDVLYLSIPPFPDLKMGILIIMYYTSGSRLLNEIMHIKSIKQYLALTECSVIYYLLTTLLLL